MTPVQDHVSHFMRSKISACTRPMTSVTKALFTSLMNRAAVVLVCSMEPVSYESYGREDIGSLSVAIGSGMKYPREREDCPTCMGWAYDPTDDMMKRCRETVNGICQTCGTNYRLAENRWL